MSIEGRSIFRKRRDLSLTAGLAAILVVGCVGGGGPTSVPGTGDSDGTNGGLVGSDPGPLTRLFASDEVWFLGSPSFILGGYGNSVEYAVLTSDQPGVGVLCLGLGDPTTESAFNDQTLTIRTQFEDVEIEQQCGVSLTAHAAACSSEIQPPENPCVLSEVSGAVTVGSNEFELGEPQIVRFSACLPPLTALPEEQWVVSNIHPFGILFLNDPGAIGGAVVIAGTGENVESASLITALEDGLPVGCVDQPSEGTLSFDGFELVVNLNFENDRALAPDCSVEYSGTLTYCSILDPAVLGGNSGSAQILRFDGTGQFSGNGRSAILNVLYLSLAENGGVSDGGIRRKTPEPVIRDSHFDASAGDKETPGPLRPR